LDIYIKKKTVKWALTISIALLIIAIFIFNLTSCLENQYNYIDMSGVTLSQLTEISSDGTIVTLDDGTVLIEKNPKNENNGITTNFPQGTQIAVVETSLGTVKARLYPEYAPETVKQFVQLATDGYYNNTYVYRVQDGIYTTFGAEKPDGSQGDKYTVANERVPEEVSPALWPFKGAWMSLETYTDNNFWDVLTHQTQTYTGTQFIMVGSMEFDEKFTAELKELTLPTEIIDAFIERGGVPNYSQQFTIFAQTFEGFDVLDNLLSLPVRDGTTLRPTEDVVIRSVTIETV
jgi:peptidyl-prolyl cis-trans isomerase B (cyclophilin B)